MSTSPKLESGPSPDAAETRFQVVPGRSVLIADDHADTRLMLRTILEMHHFIVLEAADGETAVALTASERPDIVLMDFSLPVLDGLGALRLLKANKVTRDVPIIFLSGRAEPGPQLAVREAGGDDFLVKPVDLDKMLQLIERRITPAPRQAAGENY